MVYVMQYTTRPAVAHASAGPSAIVKGDPKSCPACIWLDDARTRAWIRRDTAAQRAYAEQAVQHYYAAHWVSP